MMKPIEKIYNISKKQDRIIAGLMSGTSLDGLDVAICRITGHGYSTKVELLYFTTVPYSGQIRSVIQNVFAKNTIRLDFLCQLNAFLGRLHGEIVLDVIRQSGLKPSDIDLVASHGQTIFHHPRASEWFPHSSTLQIGDGDHIAQITGIITVSDFRQKHIAAGGEGAPLALYGERLWLRHLKNHRILLNLGGIGNITFLPAASSDLREFTTDTGPANTLIDQYCQKYLNIPYDKNGQSAEKGRISEDFIHELIHHPFFSLPYPKSTGQEDFNLSWVEKILEDPRFDNLSSHDILASLGFFTVSAVKMAIENCIPTTAEVQLFVSGGGCHNRFIMNGLQNILPGITICSFSDLGVNPDAKEAILFAILANETIAGEGDFYGESSVKQYPEVHFGKISLPG